MDVVEPVLTTIGRFIDAYLSFHAMKDACKDFYRKLTAAAGIPEGIQDTSNESSNQILQKVIDLSLKAAHYLLSPTLTVDDENVWMASVSSSPHSLDHCESLICPISYEIMEDPVEMFPYGKTYDCKNLCRWLLLKPNRDPTGKEFDQPLIFLPNLNLREGLMRDYGKDAYVPYDLTQFYKKYDKAWKRLQQSKNGPLSGPSDTRPNQIAEHMFNLACQYRDGTGGKGLNVENAICLMKQAAQQGHAGAQNGLGLMYMNGHGVKRDQAEAVRLFRLAADQGHAAAQYNLGLIYKDGDGVKRDYAEAVRLLRLAADQGHAAAQANLGVMYKDGDGVKRDYGEAVRLLRLATNQNNAAAQYNLGLMYKDGDGVKRDYAEAVRLFRLAADRGHAAAQYCLGTMYKDGNGVKRDQAEAVRLYKLAADQGHAGAQYNLGVMYQKGHGVKRDYAEAVRLYKLAANQGHATAQNGLYVVKKEKKMNRRRLFQKI